MLQLGMHSLKSVSLSWKVLPLGTQNWLRAGTLRDLDLQIRSLVTGLLNEQMFITS